MAGQNSEEAAELVATIRGEHVVMKTWFMGPSSDADALRQKYGPYPGLWKEVLNWPGWKDARKAYLKAESCGATNSGATAAESATANNDNNNANGGDSSVPRKRRSRWGAQSSSDHDADNNKNGNDNNNNNKNTQSDNHDSGPPTKRVSRWGRDQPPPPAHVALPPPPLQLQMPAVHIPGLPGLGLPGLPSNLSPQQQQEMQSHQQRLREINDKLGNLDQEAARVDALPRGHRERSPSPPPGTYMHISYFFLYFVCSLCSIFLFYFLF
jgi:hypothetical protein